MADVTQNPYPAVTPLTLPCTIGELRNWIKDADGLIVGSNSRLINATASGVSVVP